MLLTRIDLDSNMARFYRLEISRDLLGGVVLIRNWGRIGAAGRECRQWFDGPEDAEQELQLWASRKQRRGYRLAGPAIVR